MGAGYRWCIFSSRGASGPSRRWYEVRQDGLAFCGISLRWARPLARGTSAARRCMNSSGDITMCVVPSRQGLLSCSTTFPAHPGMQAEAERIGAQARRGFLGPARHGAQAQHLLSGTRPQRDAIAARGRLQGRKRVIRVDVGQIGHAAAGQALGTWTLPLVRRRTLPRGDCSWSGHPHCRPACCRIQAGTSSALRTGTFPEKLMLTGADGMYGFWHNWGPKKSTVLKK